MEETNIEDTPESGIQSNNSDNGPKQIAGAILIVGILIAGAILLKGSSVKNTAPIVNNNDDTEILGRVRPVSKEDHIVGNLNAKVVIIEYSDTECPYCKVFHNTMHRVVADSDD